MPASNATKSQSQSSQADRGKGQSDMMDMTPTADLVEYCKEYARQKPEMAALWCFGIGFVLGWKLKPW